jgi:sensory rhodopsin
MISPLLVLLILINTLFLFILLIKSLNENINSKYDKILRVDLAILGIAFTQYAMTFIIENSNVLEKDATEFAQQLRYVDWLITTPLLLYSYWKLAEIEGWNGEFIWLLFADLIMMGFGILAEFLNVSFKIKILLYTIGCLGYVYIFIEIVRIMNFFKNKKDSISSDKANLGYYFLIGWLIYPIGFFLPFEPKFILYSFGDFINKGLYSIALQSTFK